MPNTHLRKQFLPRIDKLNDQLWYFLFTSEELNHQIAAFSLNARENFTTDLFHTNQYSPRIHIRVRQLLDQQQRNKQFTFGSYFSTAYETFSYYLHELFQSIISFNGYAGPAWRSRDSPEQNIQRLFVQNALPLPPDRVLRTISYLRFKRNHFTHLADTPTTAFVTFINHNGAALNNDWVTTNIVQNIDFTVTANPSLFTQDVTIELFKLMRIVLIELDEHAGGLLDSEGIAGYIARHIFGHEAIRTNLFIRQDRTTKIRTQARRVFRRNLTVADCAPFVSTVGIR